MDETKQTAGIEDVLRQVAKHRDKLLRKAPVLSPARRAILIDRLAREFPLETALREASTKRDQLLPVDRSGIPPAVESMLHRQLDALEAAGLARGPRKLVGLRPLSSSLQQLRGGLVSLAACAMIIAAILCFGSWRTSSLRHAVAPNAPRLDEANIHSGTGLFIPKVSIRPFNLNTNEPASLQASIVANSGMNLVDRIEAPLNLRLDLPVRAILTEDSLARTP